VTVHQVEDYFISMSDLNLSDGQIAAIDELLEEEGYSNYEWQDDNKTLVVDDIPSEFDGDNLQDQIDEIIG